MSEPRPPNSSWPADMIVMAVLIVAGVICAAIAAASGPVGPIYP